MPTPSTSAAPRAQAFFAPARNASTVMQEEEVGRLEQEVERLRREAGTKVRKKPHSAALACRAGVCSNAVSTLLKVYGVMLLRACAGSGPGLVQWR